MMKRTNDPITYLCQIAGWLGIPIVQLRDWPASAQYFEGVFVAQRNSTDTDQDGLFCGRHADPPVILLRYGNPEVLAHELGHAAVYLVCGGSRERDYRPLKPWLDRIAKRCRFYYGRQNYVELRAECLGRRLLGESFPPALLRFTARAWHLLEFAVQQVNAQQRTNKENMYAVRSRARQR